MASDLALYEATDAQRARFWESLLLAVETEPRHHTSIRGASGIHHPLIAVGVDDIRRRIVIISREPHSKAAALAQVDIQAATAGYNVIVARPISVNFGPVAKFVTEFASAKVLNRQHLLQLSKAATDKAPEFTVPFEKLAASLVGISWASMDLTAEWQEGIQQLANIAIQFANPEPGNPDTSRTTVDFTKLVELDPTQSDRALGNCAIPLYEFDPTDAEPLHRGTDIEAVRDVLRRLQLFQYFFPPPDHLVLGITENHAHRPSIISAMNEAPRLGHPLGSMEVLASSTRVEDVVDVLLQKNFLVEGEVGLELSDTGRAMRSTIRFKPREGFLEKLSRVFSLKVDLNPTSWFK